MDDGFKKLLITIGVFIVIALFFTLIRFVKSNDKYKNQIKKIENALKEWGEEYEEFLPQKTGEVITVPLQVLKQSGYIEEGFKNTKTKEKFSNQMLMKITKVKKEYQYEVFDEDENMIKEYDDINKKAPMVVLKGEKVEYAELNKEYEDLGYIAITVDGKKADEVKISIEKDGKAVSRIDTSSAGTYKVTYRTSYAKEDSSITRIVVVRDTEKPEVEMEKLIITLEDVDTLDLMDGVTMKDNSNEELQVKTIGEVKKEIGKYIITYQVSDSSGNMTEKKRVIRVEEENNVDNDEQIDFDDNINNSD